MGNKKILIVDDSSFILSIVGNSLREEGYTVIESKNGKDGIKNIIKEQPDCVILDLLMPEMSGMDILKILKHEKISVPTIILTADIQDTTRQRCIENGAAEFLSKPLKKEELLKAVKKITENSIQTK